MKEKKEPSPTFRKVDAVVTKCSRVVAWVGAAALFFTAIISTANVIATKVFGSPIDNVTELVTYLNIPIVFFCIGFVQLDHGHTHIDLIYRHFPKPMHTAIHIIGYVIGVVICGFAGWRGMALAMQKYAASSYAAGPSSFLIWPFVACIGIGYLVLALCFVWCIPRELAGCGPYELGGDDPSSQEGA